MLEIESLVFFFVPNIAVPEEFVVAFNFLTNLLSVLTSLTHPIACVVFNAEIRAAFQGGLGGRPQQVWANQRHSTTTTRRSTAPMNVAF